MKWTDGVCVCVCVWWCWWGVGGGCGCNFEGYLEASCQCCADVIICFDYPLTSPVPVASGCGVLRRRNNRVTCRLNGTEETYSWIAQRSEITFFSECMVWNPRCVCCMCKFMCKFGCIRYDYIRNCNECLPVNWVRAETNYSIQQGKMGYKWEQSKWRFLSIMLTTISTL